MEQSLKITKVEFKAGDRTVRPRRDKVLAYAKVTFNGVLMIHDFKILQKPDGELKVDMPSRRETDNCPSCGFRNGRYYRYCNDCGRKITQNVDVTDPQQRERVYSNVAHAVTNEFRLYLIDTILEAWEKQESEAQRLLGQCD